MSSSKQIPEGREQCLRVLGEVDPNIKQISDEACSKFFRGGVARDDILDAFAAAVTAHQGRDALGTVPQCPPLDPKGLPMEMVSWESRK